MNKFKILFTILMSLVVASCASLKVTGIPNVMNSLESSKVRITRSGSLNRGARAFYVTLDDENISKIKRGQSLEFEVSAGPHRIGVKCPTQVFSVYGLPFFPYKDVFDYEYIEVNLESKKVYNFVIDTEIIGCAKIEII